MSDIHDTSTRPYGNTEDDHMRDGDEEGEGEDVEMQQVMDDSSEEESDDEEEARRIREGFIVDEDEDEDEDEEEEKQRRKRQKRRKKRHHREEDEQLEDDDLELLEENTGGAFRSSRFKRLRRKDDESPPAARRKGVVHSSDDDLDNDNERQRGTGIQSLWDDERRDDHDDEGDMDTDSFIEYSDEEEAAGNEEAREERRREKKQDAERRKRARRVRPELAGIDANAWDEIHDVFGDGHDYDWALVDEEEDHEMEVLKPEMRYQDVFEPTEIRKRMLTEDDDLIRARDIPERMQLATSSLSQSSTLLLHSPMTEDDLSGAAMWVINRLPPRKNALFFAEGGQYFHLSQYFVLAVTFVLRSLFLENYEVPYIWVHKRDYISHFDQETKEQVELLSLPDLWTILQSGYKYRSLLERKKTLSTFYERLQVQDEYFENDIMAKLDGVEVVADATDWLSMKYKDKKPEANFEFQFHDDAPQAAESKKHKTPSRISAYEVAKKSIVGRLAKGFGIEAQQVVQNFMTASHLHDIDDPELSPIPFAEQYVDPDPAKAVPAEELLARARLILATELGKDPLLRQTIRKKFKDEALISVEPTERGMMKIDDHHPYYNFKYLHRKPIRDMLDSPQFLLILTAEAEHLVTVSIHIAPAAFGNLEKQLIDAACSDNFNESAKSWNAERTRVVQEVFEQHLIPLAIKWTREYLRGEVENNLAHACAENLRRRVDVAPYKCRRGADGESSASVLALSWGKGDPHKDAITMVFLDEAGRMREHTKIDNLHDGEMLDEFFDLLKRRKPDAIAVGGFSMATLKLAHRVKELLKGPTLEEGWGNQQAFDIPVVYVKDDVARIYQHSKRGADEFPAMPPIAKYCVGMARYLQSPLNEFAALGSDITAITFSEDDQHLVPREKLLSAFERVLVDVTNKVGVNINRAVTDEYYQHLLPFVCGLGPRKAQAMVKKIAALGGNLNNREQFIKGSVLTTKIFFNASAFLRIPQYRENNELKHRSDDDQAPDPLDDTRIHLEDYELARKMATDALEMDEEDIQDDHPSHVVVSLMADKERERKLMELNLDDFAVSLYEANHEDKRHTLGMIREELLAPFADNRRQYQLPGQWEVITMLSGETEKSLSIGVIVSASVMRLNRTVVNVKLDSGVEGQIKAEYVSDKQGSPGDHMKKGQTVPCIIIGHNFDLENADSFSVELSARERELSDGDSEFRRVVPDDHWNSIAAEKDKELMERRKRRANEETRRVIKHPNFQNLNSTQAEAYLKNQQRGDVVIRPSSKGSNHLAVTWKVDEDLYQHIDVQEINANPNSNGQTIDGQLRVDDNHIYADLDELIVNHVQAMARKVEELMAHEKYKAGSEDDLHLFLKNFLAANPAKSMYGFTLNRKRPGHFNLCFLANKKAMVQTWPVRVAPEAYYLFEAQAAGVPELCDAFKVRHAAASSQAAAGGGKTPYGAGLGRTPARPFGGATPGHMSVRQPNPLSGRTPNPYHHGQQMGPPGYGGPPPNAYGGFQTPAHMGAPGHPPMPPGGMPPRPMANSGWGQPGGPSGW